MAAARRYLIVPEGTPLAVRLITPRGMEWALEEAPAAPAPRCEHRLTMTFTAGDPYQECRTCGAFRMAGDVCWRMP